jgi:hypothetical protein
MTPIVIGEKKRRPGRGCRAQCPPVAYSLAAAAAGELYLGSLIQRRTAEWARACSFMMSTSRRVFDFASATISRLNSSVKTRFVHGCGLGVRFADDSKPYLHRCYTSVNGPHCNSASAIPPSRLAEANLRLSTRGKLRHDAALEVAAQPSPGLVRVMSSR